MISKSKVSFIKSLQVKKYRLAEQCFLVQGAKAVRETLESDYVVVMLCGTAEFIRGTRLKGKSIEVIEASEKELAAVGSLEANDGALAVVRMKKMRAPFIAEGKLTLALDNIRDPGNLGTIIRTADWYGVERIIASEETADFHNPKVINATMGSFLRIDLCYAALPLVLSKTCVPVYGAFLDGSNVHEVKFGSGGVIVVGNESRGISPEVARQVKYRITIPGYGSAESLNASVAAAVILDNIRRGS